MYQINFSSVSFHAQPVDGTKSAVFSAYVDDRETPNVSRSVLPVVRIFAYFPRRATAKLNNKSWLCLFWTEDEGSPPTVVPVQGYVDINEFRKIG